MHKKHVFPKWDIPPHKELFCFREAPSAWIELDHKFKACFKDVNRKLEEEVERYLESLRQKQDKMQFKTHDLKRERKQRPRRMRKQNDQRFVKPTVQSKSCYSLEVSSTSLSSDYVWPYKTNIHEGVKPKSEAQEVSKAEDTRSSMVLTKCRFLVGSLKQFLAYILSSSYYKNLARPILLMVSVLLAVRYFSTFKKSSLVRVCWMKLYLMNLTLLNFFFISLVRFY